MVPGHKPYESETRGRVAFSSSGQIGRLIDHVVNATRIHSVASLVMEREGTCRPYSAGDNVEKSISHQQHRNRGIDCWINLQQNKAASILRLDQIHPMTNGSGDVLTRAKSLLGSMQTQGQRAVFRDSTQVAETLFCTVSLLRDFDNSLQDLDPSSPNWKIVKALLELLTRLGISPFLNPEVGIAHTENSSNVFAGASAISCHLYGLANAISLLQIPDFDPDPGEAILFSCVEVMASFVWKTSGPDVNVEQDIPSSIKEYTPYTQPMSNPMAQMILKFFLQDMMAAYMQLAHASQQKGDSYSHIASSRLNQMVKDLPAEEMIEASFMLLNRRSPSPPPWLKAEIGKQLSRLIMKQGGLVAVLQELVGQTTKGNVELYDKISSHLAKIPKSIATDDEYIKAISMQLLPLLLCKFRDMGVGETSLTARTNIYHTAVSLACKLFLTNITLAKKYVLEPIMASLHAWEFSQNALGDPDICISENELVDSIVQLLVLLTAGCRRSSFVREEILNETESMAPLLLKLHFQLEGSDSNSILAFPYKNSTNGSKKKSSLTRECILKGFLQNGLNTSDVTNENLKEQSLLSRLKSSLADIVMIEWPNEQGEVWKTLRSGSSVTSPAMYISRLLCSVENWPLLVALLRNVLQKILNLRSSLTNAGTAEEILRCMDVFEVLNSEAGSAALEHDTPGAASLVKDLLDEDIILSDEGILEIILDMVNHVLNGYQSAGDVGQLNERNVSLLSDIAKALEKIYTNACLSEKLRQMSFQLSEKALLLYRSL